MTAEICVMNTMGVAMAADSAVTIGGGKKVYNSANKLFSLSKFHPVGIMIYGNANFVRLPWEPIIKVFRQRLGTDHFDTTKEYADKFIDFLTNPPFDELNSLELEKSYVLSTLNDYLHNLAKNTINLLKRRVNDFPDKTNEQNLIDITTTEIEKLLVEYDNKEFINSFTEEDVRYLLEKYDSEMEHLISTAFEKMLVSADFITSLKFICANFLLKDFSSSRTGLVISGFGEKDIYPSLYSYYIEGKVNQKLKIQLDDEEKIDLNCTATIIPFAQSDMASTFLNGIDPDLNRLSNAFLSKLFEQLPSMIFKDLEKILVTDDKIKEGIRHNLSENINKFYKRHQEVIKEYQKQSFTDPILEVVQALPKDELAEIAEALVNLTSFRRKVSSNIETVGGPIDVAVITKGDGMVWIKRKHYFNANLNQQFHQNYFRSDINESSIIGEEPRN